MTGKTPVHSDFDELHGIADWLVRIGSASDVDSAATFGEFCDRMARVIPVHRSAIQLENLHPTFYGYCLHWEAGKPAFELARTFAFGESEEFARSPYMAALDGGGTFRQRIGEMVPSLPLLVRLKGEGYTDFVADFVATGELLPPGISWATRHQHGLSDGQASALTALTPLILLVFRAQAERRKTQTVLSTYLGAEAGRQVAQGRTRRGDTSTLNAVIMFADLRGFTALSSGLADRDLLAMLNSYLEAVSNAVSDAGGDIVKFVGDGVLALFPVAEAGDLRGQCQGATKAARSAHFSLHRGERPLDMVAALSCGVVSFGNIGGRERLDFTVVGAAVNMASRLERLAKEIGVPIIATPEVAAHLDEGQKQSAGRHAIRGVPGLQEVFSISTRV